MSAFFFGKQKRKAGGLAKRPTFGVRCRITVSGLILLLSIASSALAIDCKSKTDASGKLICGNEQLAAAYGKMELAYDKLLRKAPDDEVRSMLQMSQERWRAALNLAVDMIMGESDVPDDDEAEEGADEEHTPQVITMNNIEARLGDLSSLENDGTPTLIAKALKQRHFAAKFSGGTFAGFETNCDFLPPDYRYYACFSTQHYQNGERICSQEEYWASGSVYEHRFVADVVHDEPKLVASCTFNGNDTSCLGDGAGGNRWNVRPAPRSELYPTRSLPKLDAEIDTDDQRWLETCLTDPSFPMADPTRSGEEN
ncbi:hypothetical protein NIBR502774_14250 (plasmid) [Rhizobium sp. NIBRBAC000502774]|nr:hypothetical protein NIBR502774_14250 [Rhizobium sp. NIBRBAC000502774]